jgi:moderate conductance mechanosensitive channel
MLLYSLFKSIIIIIGAYAILKVIRYVTSKIFDITRFDRQYEKTLSSIIISFSYYVIFIVTVTLILREFKIIDFNKFETLVTGAGIVGLIAGLAVQSFLKDILNGFFILFEKQMKVGDFVIINEEFRGTVEEIGLRSLSIRDWDSRRITIPNGNITSLRNYSRNKMRAVVHVRVSYEEDPIYIIEVLEEVCNILNEKYKQFLIKNMMNEPSEPFSVYGVTDIVDVPVGVQYTITGSIEPFKYFDALKDARLQILITFREKGIKVAYPTNVNILYNGYSDYVQEKSCD